MDPKSNDQCSCKRKKVGNEDLRHRDTEEMQREEGHVRMQAEIWVMQPEAKEHQGLPTATEAGGGRGGSLPQRLQEEATLPTS